MRLAVFDLDGTLKQVRDPYVYLHRRLGVLEQARDFPDLYARGEITSEEWCALDAALWRGVERARLESLLREIPYTPGARELVAELEGRGVTVAVVSSGLMLHATQVRAELGLDYAFANELLFEDDRATGQIRVHVQHEDKGAVMRCIMAREGVGPEACLAVGDTASDAALFALARVGVAVNPDSERARTAAHIVIDDLDLRGLVARLRAFDPAWLPPFDENAKVHYDSNYPRWPRSPDRGWGMSGRHLTDQT